MHMGSAMPCNLRKPSGTSSLKAPTGPEEKTRDERRQEEILCSRHHKSKTVHTCKCEAHESTRKRIPQTQSKDHEDRIAEKGFNSLSHYNLVHKFIPMLQALKTLEAQAAVDREWEKLKNLPAWQESKVKSKQEVIEQAQKEGKTVHFATIMDLCHFESSELDKKIQNKKNVLYNVVLLCKMTQARMLCSPSRDLPRHT